MHLIVYYFFFFFQAEDGIRDFHVTGVQTCALPISFSRPSAPNCWKAASTARPWSWTRKPSWSSVSRNTCSRSVWRSEERRVGKECRARGSPDHEKKKK